MIDINLIRNNPEVVEKAILKRGIEIDLKPALKLDEEKRALIAKIEEMRARKNEVSAKIPAMKKAGENTDTIFAEMKELGDEIDKINVKLNEITKQLDNILLGLPNMPDEDIIAGGKENNQPIYTFGKKPEFDFEPKNHVELCTSLGLIDYERAAKMSGNGFWIYRGLGAQLEWALLNFFVSEHLKDGYEFVLPPEMLNAQCGIGSGQFPKFADEVYYVDRVGNEEGAQQFLLPTAESAMVNLYAGEIIPEEQLPFRMFAYSPCFRKEAGSYRAEERGMIRGHQFNKVEMIAYATKEQSDAMFEELVKKAQTLVEKLGLHYQLSKLAAADISATMARTYDIEVWIPSMNIYKEVSSVSNGRCYQPRRSNTKYKTKDGKNEFVHMLNGSGLATPRLIPAIVEQFQNKDGSVTIPEVLRPFMGGLEKIEPKK
ncbi:MAG: serine--tRNA ligase [Clostridia bacterium]|nr:serine--tRNA ligase [Clostridia bacterium]